MTVTLAHNPDAHILRRELADAYVRSGMPEKAKEQFEELIRRAPEWKDISMVYTGLGNVYRSEGDLDQAEFNYEKGIATARSTRDYVTFNNLGLLHMERDDPLMALTYFCQSLQLLPEGTSSQQNFDLALRSVGTISSEHMRASFGKMSEQHISVYESQCSEESCKYAFAYRQDFMEVLLPGFISTESEGGEEVAIMNRSFNPQMRIISLEVDTVEEELTFLFPTCNRMFYEVSV